MSIKLSIPILQRHNVCPDGQHQFRRKFTRERTWETLESFTKAFAQYHTLWNWDEAAEKFLGEGGEEVWADRRDKLEAEWAEQDDSEWSDNQAGCVAWCQLYWEKMHDSATGKPASKVPDAARAYLEAVEALEKTIKFKKALTPRSSLSVDVNNYHTGNDGPAMKFIKDKFTGQLPALVDEAIKHYEQEIARLKQELHDVLNAEATPAEVQPAAVIAA